jgi:hypothetical protein
MKLKIKDIFFLSYCIGIVVEAEDFDFENNTNCSIAVNGYVLIPLKINGIINFNKPTKNLQDLVLEAEGDLELMRGVDIKNNLVELIIWREDFTQYNF